MSTAIEMKNVKKIYSDFLLDNVNLTLPTGCIMQISSNAYLIYMF